MKYILYCRKSTESEDRQVLSLESQENEMLKLAANEGLEIVQILRESQSAKEPGRPVFNEAIRLIEKGSADALLCWKIDRLTRNPVDGGQIQWLLQKGRIKAIRTFERTYSPSDNVLLINIEQAMANQYIIDLSTNVKRGIRAKLERGEWPNRAPLGYINDKATHEIVIDPLRSRYIVEAFKLYASGKYGFGALAEHLHERGFRSHSGRKVLKNNMQSILMRTVYYGEIQHEGKTYQGKHKPLISKQLFDQAQRVMHDHSHPRPQRLLFPLRGLIRCDHCGCAFTASLKKGHQYYYCTNGKGRCDQHKKYTRGTTMNMVVAELLDRVNFSQRKIDLMYQAAYERTRGEFKDKNVRRDEIKKQLESLSAQESRLVDILVDGKIEQAIFDRKAKELTRERSILERQLLDLDSLNPSDTLERTKEVFLTANKAKKEFLAANDEQKQEIAKKLLWNFSIKNQTVAQIKYKSPFDIMAKAAKNADSRTLLGDLESNQDTQLQRLLSYR